MNISNLSTAQLNQIITIRQKIENLQAEIESIAGGGQDDTPASSTEEAHAHAKRKLSPAHRRKLIKALKKARKIRLANLKAAGGAESKPAKKRRMSRAGRAAIAAAQKARWAKVRGSKAPLKPSKKDRRSSPATKAKLAAAAKARWSRVKGEGRTGL